MNFSDHKNITGIAMFITKEKKNNVPNIIVTVYEMY